MHDLSRIVKAYDIRGVVPDEFDEQVASAVGAAFVRLTSASQVVTAHDMRSSSGPLSAAFARGAAAQGADVIEAGLGSTVEEVEKPVFVATVQRIRDQMKPLGINLPAFSHPKLGVI